MNDYCMKLKRARRGAILRHLAECRDYTANADILLSVVNGADHGITSYYADVTADLSWLESKGYVALSGNDAIVIAEITTRGLRLASGDAIDAGVDRPAPRL